jgi:hypothetical protein
MSGVGTATARLVRSYSILDAVDSLSAPLEDILLDLAADAVASRVGVLDGYCGRVSAARRVSNQFSYQSVPSKDINLVSYCREARNL